MSGSGQATMPLNGGMTALSLGIETRGNQPNIKVTVYQGLAPRVAENEQIGAYEVVLPDAVVVGDGSFR